MATTTAKKVFLFFFILVTPAILNGCAVVAPLAAVAGPEVAGTYATDGIRVTGGELREGADFSFPYPKHLDTTLALDHADWICFRGRGQYLGEELCLLPGQEKKITKRMWFSCRIGRGGGTLTQLFTKDKSLYCTRDGGPTAATHGGKTDGNQSQATDSAGSSPFKKLADWWNQ